MNTSARLILSSIILDNIDKLLSLIVERDKINGINLSDADKSKYSQLDYIAEEKQSWMEAIIEDYKLFDNNEFIVEKSSKMYSHLLSMLNWKDAKPTYGSAN